MTLAALLLPFALLQAEAAPAPAAAAADPSAARLARCVAAIEANPEQGYEEAMAWAADTHEVDAYECSAMALVAMGHIESGARRFELAARGVPASNAGARAMLYSKAGNAYLLARDGPHALAALSEAVTLLANTPAALPDALIDRARAYAMVTEWRQSEEDLSRALDLRPNDALALRLRADARMRQHAFDLAEADAQAAVTLEPNSVDARLALGNVREAKRTGEPPLN
ncbi:MAG: hypothetical protein AB7L65_07730 [Hyphomonadaceae bacterium]